MDKIHDLQRNPNKVTPLDVDPQGHHSQSGPVSLPGPKSTTLTSFMKCMHTNNREIFPPSTHICTEATLLSTGKLQLGSPQPETCEYSYTYLRSVTMCQGQHPSASAFRVSSPFGQQVSLAIQNSLYPSP